MRGPLAYVYNHVPPIGGRQKVLKLSRALLRFNVMVCVCTLVILGMASFRGRGSPVGPRFASGSAGLALRPRVTKAIPGLSLSQITLMFSIVLNVWFFFGGPSLTC